MLPGINSAEHARVSRERIENLCGRAVALYSTMGACDFVPIFEMPSETAMMRYLLVACAAGGTRTAKCWERSELVVQIDADCIQLHVLISIRKAAVSIITFDFSERLPFLLSCKLISVLLIDQKF
jgi:hypothetical protein